MNYIYRCGFLSTEKMMLGIPIRDILEQEYERDMETFIVENEGNKMYNYKYGVREPLLNAMKDVRALIDKGVLKPRDDGDLKVPDFYFPVYTLYGNGNPQESIGHGFIWINLEKAYPTIWSDAPVMGKKYEIGTVEEKVFENGEEKSETERGIVK